MDWDGLNFDNLIKWALIIVGLGLAGFMSFIIFKTANKTVDNHMEVLDKVVALSDLENEIVSEATTEIDSAIITDKTSMKRRVGESYKIHRLELKLSDDTVEKVRVTYNKFNEVKVNDEIQVRVYRSDRYKELDKNAENDIVKVEIVE